MDHAIFTGVCTALVTPFLDDKVNYPLVEQLLRRQIDTGVTTVVLSGTTGESPTLSDQEKIELFKRAKIYTGSTCTIIAGTGSNSTIHTLELSRAAQDAGADGLLLVAPYYNKGNPEGLYEHFITVADAVNIPIILYNVPSRTGVDIPVTVYKRLSEHPNIAGVKEASTDITKIAKIRCTCKSDFHVWSGNDDQIVPVISLGGKGVISVLSNICPEETVAMANAALAGDFDTAAAIQCQLMPLINLLFSEVNPIPIKYAMQYAGFDCGNCRLPLGPLSLENKRRIDKFFA